MDEDVRRENTEETREEEAQSTGRELVDAGKDKLQEEAKKQAEKLMKEAAKKGAKETSKIAAKSSTLAALGPILFWAIIIILAIIIIVGIVMFFMTMPGMVMDQLKKYAGDLADAIASWFGADTTEQIEEQEVYDVLNYLEQMGYDLKGYGFISQNADSTHANYDKNQGVIRDPNTGLIMDIDTGGLFDNGIQEAYSDIINLYLMSDNYVYTIKNFNNVSTWWTGFKWLQALFQHLGDMIGMDDTKWGKGLISIKREDGDVIGQVGGSYGNGFLSWNSIEIDASAKKMRIRRGWGNNYFEYNLDGWIGRYGMPLEFLLSLHISTMKPDLTYEMVTEFNTDVLILIRSIEEGSVEAAYQTPSGTYVTYSQIRAAINESYSGGGVGFIEWFDNLNLTPEEASNLFALGFDRAPGCSCSLRTTTEENEDGELVTVPVTDENGVQLYDICSACAEQLGNILDILNRTSDYNFETFVPYLKQVTNHWFRDVYFVLTPEEAATQKLTRIDYDYEKITNERWTMYEIYTEGERAGEYKLYEYDPNTSDGIGALYNGTQEEADKEGIKVVKKQVDTKAADLAADGIITLKDDGGWSAYDEEVTSSDNWERVYPDASESTIEGRIYYKVRLPGNVVQKEDGVRAVTNAKIKDMFLNRNYFNYDGSAETADVIKELRNTLGMNYGSIPDSDLDTEFSVNIQTPNESGSLVSKNVSGKIGDYTSNVSITQDSLAGFSMLENTHTQDADFIYKDFKELIVELGYFEKEELSDGRARLLQWLIPEIGSGGFPKRVLDKKENEYGTLAHSKEDYEINQKNTLEELLAGVDPTTDSPEGAENGPSDELIAKSIEKNLKSVHRIATFDSTPMANFTSVRGTDISTCDYTFTSTGDSGMGVKRGDLEVDGVAYEVWQQTHSTCTLYSLAFICNAYTGQPFIDYITRNDGNGLVNEHSTGQGGNAYWLAGAGVIWAPMEEETGGGMFYTASNKPANMAELVVEALGEGKPVYFYGSYGSSAGYHAVVLLGKDSDGSILIYNPGGGTLDNFGSGDFLSNVRTLIDTEGFNMPGHTIYIPDNPPEGRKPSGEPYEGYKGNEAVVSPVTGILLEYGTYTDDDVADGYRKNSDMPEETDKVGYAKILVLNEEVADQITGCTKHNVSGKIEAGNVKSRINNAIEDELRTESNINVGEILEDNLSEAEQALYGYDLFCEDYENNKIGGYLIYIDGFKCELPGEVAESEDEDEPIEITTPGEALSMEYFKEKAASGSNSSFTACTYEETLYEKDETYNLVSELMEAKSEAEAESKDIAAPLYKFTGILNDETKEMLIIKEGTVIGRTLTDKELVEDYRGDVYITEEDAMTTETDPTTGETREVDSREVRGNYLRIIMRDLDDTVVENVEDYMKLDEEGNPEFDGEFSEEFLFWLAFLLEGLDMGDCVDGYCTAIDINDGTVTAGPGVTNHCNALFWELGYEEYMHYRRGANVGMEVGDEIPVDVLIDVMMLYLEGTLERLEQDFPGNSFDEFQVAALVSVYYNFGSVPESLKNAINNNGNIQYVWEHLSDSQADDFPGLPKRRKGEYIMFSQGIWVDVYSGTYDELQFKSDTPFTDALNGNWPL